MKICDLWMNTSCEMWFVLFSSLRHLDTALLHQCCCIVSRLMLFTLIHRRIIHGPQTDVVSMVNLHALLKSVDEWMIKWMNEWELVEQILNKFSNFCIIGPGKIGLPTVWFYAQTKRGRHALIKAECHWLLGLPKSLFCPPISTSRITRSAFHPSSHSHIFTTLS